MDTTPPLASIGIDIDFPFSSCTLKLGFTPVTLSPSILSLAVFML
jgi:hypothetical protein